MIGNVVSIVVAAPTLIGLKLAEILRQQRRTKQGENLTEDVGKQGDGWLGLTILRDEDARQ